MTQLELQAFLAVTRTGSFSQAAQSLFISQPALSRRIRTLEEELGFRLLERQKGARSVEPTQEGRAFAPVAEHWLALWEEARSIPQREENQVFRVASVGSVSTYILAPVLQRFLLDGTSSLTFHQYHSLESYGYVERGEVDLAFISDDMFRRQVETIPAFREPMRLVTRPGSPLPQHVHPSQLDSAREIRMQWNPEYDLWHAFWFGSSSVPRMWFDQMSLMEEAIQWEDNWLIAPASVAASLVQSGRAQLHRASGPDHLLPAGPPAQEHPDPPSAGIASGPIGGVGGRDLPSVIRFIYIIFVIRFAPATSMHNFHRFIHKFST